MVTPENIFNQVRDRISSAQQPMVLIGGGCRNLTLSPNLVKNIDSLNIPVAVTWSGSSLSSEFVNYVGVVGQFGRPTANLAFHESDLVLALGSRLPTTVTGQNKTLLKGKIINVDIDPHELELSGGALETTPILMEVPPFIERLFETTLGSADAIARKPNAWLSGLKESFLKETASLRLRRPPQPGARLNSHEAVAALLEGAERKDTIVIDGGGTALYSGFQAAPLEQFGHVVSLNAISSMGTAPGQMVGALNANPESRVIGVIGDGSFFMALNALPTLARNIRCYLIVISNGGYLAIRHTQEKFLGSRFDGTWTPDSSPLPSVRKVSLALGFRYIPLTEGVLDPSRLVFSNQEHGIRATVIEVFTDPNQRAYWSASTRIDEESGNLMTAPLSTMSRGDEA
jgi:acetolactate synthase-1/2/3 large subunit